MTNTGEPSPSAPSTPTAPDGVEAAQAALAGEHACVYGYGVVGAFLPGDAEPARQALAAHRTRRDTLAAVLRSAGAEPVAALATYVLPAPVTDLESATGLATEMERRLAALYADVVGAAGPAELRAFAARALVDTAGWQVRWSGEVVAFPGLDGRPGAPITPVPAGQGSSTPAPSPSAPDRASTPGETSG